MSLVLIYSMTILMRLSSIWWTIKINVFFTRVWESSQKTDSLDHYHWSNWKKTAIFPPIWFLFKPSFPTLYLLGRLQPCAVTRPSSFCMWALTCLYWALFCSLRDGELHWSFLQEEQRERNVISLQIHYIHVHYCRSLGKITFLQMFLVLYQFKFHILCLFQKVDLDQIHQTHSHLTPLLTLHWGSRKSWTSLWGTGRRCYSSSPGCLGRCISRWTGTPPSL